MVALAGVNAQRLGLTDHSWVRIQIVTNIALRLGRLLFRRGITPAMVVDHGMSERDAEVVVAAAALFHCVGMSIHRIDHETYSLFLTADKLGGLLTEIYSEPQRSIVVAEAMHAVISHRSSGRPLTVEGFFVHVADALDMAKGRSRVEFEAGRLDIHSISAYAIDEVRIEAGDDKAVPASRSRCPTAPGSSRSTRGWQEAARHAAGRAHRGHRPHRGRAREAPRARIPPVMRALVWSGVEEWLAEHAQVDVLDDGILATGVQLGVEPEPYRLDYLLDVPDGWITRRLEIAASGAGWRRSLTLARARRPRALDGGRRAAARPRRRVGLRSGLLHADQPHARPPQWAPRAPPAARTSSWPGSRCPTCACMPHRSATSTCAAASCATSRSTATSRPSSSSTTTGSWCAIRAWRSGWAKRPDRGARARVEPVDRQDLVGEVAGAVGHLLGH